MLQLALKELEKMTRNRAETAWHEEEVEEEEEEEEEEEGEGAWSVIGVKEADVEGKEEVAEEKGEMEFVWNVTERVETNGGGRKCQKKRGKLGPGMQDHSNHSCSVSHSRVHEG